MATAVGNALMADEGYAGSAWDYNMNNSPDSPSAANPPMSPGHTRPSLSLQSSTNSSYSPRDSPNSAMPHLAHLPLNSAASPPRSSSESAGQPAGGKWRDSLRPLERRDTITSLPSDAGSIVEPSFDENVLRALCEMDVSQRLDSCR